MDSVGGVCGEQEEVGGVCVHVNYVKESYASLENQVQ